MEYEVNGLSEPGFQAFLQAVPGLYFVLLPDLPRYSVIAASGSCLRALNLNMDDIQGQGLFDVIPTFAELDLVTVGILRASLQKVIDRGISDKVDSLKYKVRKPDRTAIVEKYMSLENAPIMGTGGDVGYIIHKMEDITPFTRLVGDSKSEEELIRNLRESETFYRTIGEAVPDFLWACRPNGEPVFVNQRWKDYTGLTLESAAQIPENVMHHPEDFPVLQKIWAHLGEQGAPYKAEFRYRRYDGEYRWFMAKVIPVRNDDGKLMLWIGTSTDIHERKMAEAALKESEERTRLIVETALDGIITMDSYGCITGWNTQAESIFGWSREEAIGRELATTIIPEEYRKSHRHGISHFLATGEGPFLNSRMELTALHKSGNEFPVELTVSHIKMGDSHTFSAFVRDLSKSKQAEMERRESEEMFRATFEQMAVGVAHVGPEGQWLRVNQKICDIVGYKREELLNLTFQDLTHPDDLDTDLTFLRKILTGEISTFSKEKRYCHKDGSIVWINLTVSLTKKPTGEPKYFISIIEDITSRKRLENQLLQAQKLESVGRLAGGVAHDFNNLLTAILGYGELIQEGYDLPPGLREYLRNMIHAAERASRLTGQLLAFARRQVIEPKVVNLNQLIYNLNKMLRILIGEHIDLILLPEEKLYTVRVDPGQFEQILVNLIVNSRDAMPDGGKITVETTNAILDSDYCEQHEGMTPGEYAVIAISDNGIGIDEGIRLHIFEPFFTTKGQGRGTGLGLATVYGIVKQAGGHIWLYSEPGKGTTFKIYLPRVIAPVDAADTPVPAPHGLSGTETILLVEDEPAVLSMAARVLQSHGYTLLTASNGEEALRLAAGREHEIDLLVTDVVMPVMTGQELAIRLHAVHPSLKILYASGYTENTIVHHGVLEAGVAFLSKPFSPTTLARKVREVLDND